MEKQKFEVKFINANQILFNGKLLNRVSRNNSSRLIFKTKQYVIKFDDNRHSINQCCNEYLNWKDIKKTPHSKLFVPILKKGKSKNYDFIIQPRVKLQSGHPNWAWDIVGEIEDEYGFSDLHSGNWTVTEDKKSILIFDYGL